MNSYGKGEETEGMILNEMQMSQPSLQRLDSLFPQSIGIVGLGLIGGSLAKRLAAHGVRVIAWNHTSAPYDAAQRCGIECVDSLQALAAAAPSVIMLCNPLAAMSTVLEELAPFINRETTTLSDVGSVKGEVAQEVLQAGLENCYVGAHPMAGNELSGFTAADSHLFDDVLWAVTVNEHTAYSRFFTVASMITELMRNRVIVVDTQTHDRCAALISHTPHVVSTAFINMLSTSDERNIAAALAAGSWRDMTRVALTDPQRTRAMIEEDSENVARLLRDLAGRLTQVADYLQTDNAQGLTDFFDQGMPFRTFKELERQQSQVSQQTPAIREIDLSSARWQETLESSARKGEHMVSFTQYRRVQVATYSAV